MRRRATANTYVPKSRIMVANARRRPLTQQFKQATRIAASLPKGHPLRRRLLASTKVIAGGWSDKAVKELAEEEGLDADDLKVGRGPGSNSITVESRGRGDSGEYAWVVFKSERDAERYAHEYVKDMLEDEPSLFTQDWLKRFLTISKTDIRVIANEDADSYVEDIATEDEGERVVQEADMESMWDEIVDAIDELDELEYDDKIDAKEHKTRMTKLEKRRDDLIEKAKEKLTERMVKDQIQEMEHDSLGWYVDRFGEFNMNDMPHFFSLDVEEATKDAISTDGVAHFLDRYDGDETELDSGAVAYGTN
ncbi:hypothetical protein N9917_00785 [Deltaproteobacteria bacterium]|nr:hypothetical protein [Deltaproteobacteria bacterium]